MNNIRKHKAAGFTLIEMMIVVVMIGVLAAMAGPAFSNWIPRMKLKADSREKVNYLRQARSRAISDNSQYGIYFDTENSRIVFFKDISSPELLMYNAGADSLIGTPIACESNVRFSNCSFLNNAVIFFANGSASTSGAISLEDINSSDIYTISVLASTGRVRMQ